MLTARDGRRSWLVTLCRTGWPSEALPAFAAMLVAVPAAIANGLVMYAPLGAAGTAAGAMAGLVGAVALGIVAPIAGGTPRLVSAPSPAAAAFMAVLAGDLLRTGAVLPDRLPAQLVLVILVAGVVQLALGALRGGRLVKFLPYPVVAGYLAGAGLLILYIQLPKMLGVAAGMSAWASVSTPSAWKGPAVVVSGVTLGVALLAPKVTRKVPATLVGLAAGMVAYRLVGFFRPELLELTGNSLLVGPILGGDVHALGGGARRLGGARLEDLQRALVPGATLGVLVSIDTLKTCLLLDVVTKTRHDSDRELLGQGLGNLASALAGGAPGTGIVSGSLVNVNGGAKGRTSGVLAGVFALAVLVALGPLVAWLPIPALAAIVCLMAARMFQREAFELIRERHTVLDFLVVIAVIVTAMELNLAAAAGAGVALSLLLFVREQVRASIVRRTALGDAMFSKRRRGLRERAILARHGAETAVLELQGSLFFGTADRLFREVEPHLRTRRQVVLGLGAIRSVDLTAATTLRQIAAQLAERGARLVLSDLPPGRAGSQLAKYIEQLGLVGQPYEVTVYPHLDDALEWIEEQVLLREPSPHGVEGVLSLAEIELFEGLPAEALRALAGEVREQELEAGERVFDFGQPGSDLYLVRSGRVRMLMPLGNGKMHPLATIGRGEFFGEIGFTDGDARTAAATAAARTHVYALSREGLTRASAAYPHLETVVFARLAHALAARLRVADLDLRALKEM